MTNDEMMKKCIWDEDGYEAKCKCYSTIFEQDVEFQIFIEEEQEITDRTVTIINDFLNLKPNDLETIKDYLWEGCKECCEDSDYGFDVKDGQTKTEANHEGFGVFNKEDAYIKSDLMYVQIDEEENDEFNNNYALINFDNEWETHISVIVMRNGKIVGYGQSGLYLGDFEK